MRKRLVSMVMALAVCLSLGITVAATDAMETETTSLRDPLVEITPKGVATTFSIDLPKDGQYHQVYPASGSIELTPGDVSVSGTWSPTYANVSFKLIAADGGGISHSGISSGETADLYAYYSSTYKLYAKAIDAPVSGVCQLVIG